MKQRFASIFVILITLLAATSFAAEERSAEAKLSPASRQILEILKNLGTEGEDENIQKELSKFSRPKMVSAIREGLRVGGDWGAVCARSANLLTVKEVLPELEKSFQRDSGNWQAAVAIGALANDQQKKRISASWTKSLVAYPNPTKVAVIETLQQWSQPLSDALFNQLTNDESLDVRRSTVLNFIVTKSHLSIQQQTARYRKSFALDPYQVRLDAMVDYQGLSPQERVKVAGAIDSDFRSRCKLEKFNDVRIECEKILKVIP